jgi:hypothetical protein
MKKPALSISWAQRSVFLVLVCLFPFATFAQPGDPAGDPDSVVPIQGILYLIGGGMLLGIKKIITRQKQR